MQLLTTLPTPTFFSNANYFGFFYFWRGVACGQKGAVHPG